MMQNQPPEVAVFLGRDVAAFLESLKRLVSVLNALPVICSVTLYGAIPERWLYATLKSLVNNTKSQVLHAINVTNRHAHQKYSLHNSLPLKYSPP